MKDAVKKYIQYLAEQHGFQITLHGDGLLPRLCFLAPYNSHDCGYCMLVKTSTECWQRCIEGQKKAMEKLAQEGAFFGSCYAGVAEFVFPVYAFGRQVGMISVGGFAGSPEKRTAFAARYGFMEETLASMASTQLKKTVPDMEFVKTLITPLSAMLTLIIEESGTQEIHAEALYGKILSILHTRYPKKITISQIADECHYSTSFIARYFKKKSGMTINEYLKKIRMEKARHLLLHTELRIEDIAASVGFSDTNYFISFFSAHYGKPPKQYRNEKRK